jgi:heme oxygenase
VQHADCISWAAVQPSHTLRRLDLETRPLHGAADAAWRELLVDDVSETEYAAQLARVYGFEGPLEAAFAYTPRISPVIDVRRRMRSGFIAQDLLALGVQPQQIANLPAVAVAPFATVIDALGWMYVVERATPIHNRVREHVLGHLPRATRATTYLSAYETSIGSRWLELGAALDHVARDSEVVERLIVAAFDGLRCANEWYQRHRTIPSRLPIQSWG